MSQRSTYSACVGSGGPRGHRLWPKKAPVVMLRVPATKTECQDPQVN